MMAEGIKFSIMAAMMEKSRGIGYKGDLPWPRIKKDSDYVKTLIQQKLDPAKNNIFIVGRLTWENAKEFLESIENTMNIIISKTLRQKPKHGGIAQDFQAAVELAEKLYNGGNVETIWILGGQPVYTDAVNHPKCEKVYLTRIYKEYPADTYFPEFEAKYDIISESDVEDEVDGIKLQFFIYKPKNS